MLESCCTPVDIAHLLHGRYGLPAEPAVGYVTVLCGPMLGAVDMGADRGVLVLSILQDEPALPVIADPRDRKWTFLVDMLASRAGELSSGVSTGLLDVVVRTAGSRVFLPTADAGASWRWVREPARGRLRLPTVTDVLDAAASTEALSRSAK